MLPLYHSDYTGPRQGSMLGRVILIGALIWSAVATAAEVIDATGRTVQIPTTSPMSSPPGRPRRFSWKRWRPI